VQLVAVMMGGEVARLFSPAINKYQEAIYEKTELSQQPNVDECALASMTKLWHGENFEGSSEQMSCTEEETFLEAKEILSSLGMNFTEAVNVFASMIVQERGLPFDVKASQYPSISYEEAQEKVQRSIKTITEDKGIPSDEFFTKMFTK